MKAQSAQRAGIFPRPPRSKLQPAWHMWRLKQGAPEPSCRVGATKSSHDLTVAKAQVQLLHIPTIWKVIKAMFQTARNNK